MDAKMRGAPAVAPPATGAARLPVAFNGSLEVTQSSLAGLYQRIERGAGGFFPLGDGERFHCGVHLAGTPGEPVYAIADGELVAARLSHGPSLHAWGDTGFILLRHAVQIGGAEKTLYSLYVQLKREPLHPGTAGPRWLQQLLAGSVQEEKKLPKWRVHTALPAWSDDAIDGEGFSPVNAQHDSPLEPGLYEQTGERLLDHQRYVKLGGKWVRAAGGNGDAARLHELSRWGAFDLDAARAASPLLDQLAAGKTVLFDADKDERGQRKWRVRSGELIGAVGRFFEGHALHVSVFSAEPVFPAGALPEQELAASDLARLAEVDVSSLPPGSPDHVAALATALDPSHKLLAKRLGAEPDPENPPNEDEPLVSPDELRAFYRAPAHSWRARYLAVKGLADFNGRSVRALIAQERRKQRSAEERARLRRDAQDLLFWKSLAGAEELPADGIAWFVHPITALRLMSPLAAQPPRPAQQPLGGDDRLHANDDVVLSLRDRAGPVAGLEVTVVAEGKIVRHAATDAAGELLLPHEEVRGQVVEVEVAQEALGAGARLINVANETGGPIKLEPGVAPSKHPFNAHEVSPRPSLLLAMQLAQGRSPTLFESFDDGALRLETPLERSLLPGETLLAERIVLRSQDGRQEIVEALTPDGQRVYLRSIEDGTANLLALPDRAILEAAGGKPAVIASWSAELAHVNDQPIFAGRVVNLDDGAQLTIELFAMRAIAGPEHDEPLGKKTVTVANGGFACALEPAQLLHGSDLLTTARPVFASVTLGERTVVLRSQVITLYASGAVLPKLPPELPAKVEAGATLRAFFQIARDGSFDPPTTWDGAPAPTRTLAEIADLGLRERFSSESGWEQLVVGPITTHPHLALGAQLGLSPAQALAEQEAATRALFPEAPEWLFAHGDQPFAADNGIAMGLCAQHCKDGVSDWGLASGCSEEIRIANLSSCKTAHHGICQRVRPPKPTAAGSLAVLGQCAELPGKCGEARHDKRRCFFAQPLPGADAEARERWHIALPLRGQDAKGRYPYLGVLRVLVINPLTGAAVVCSQEARGPSSRSGGSAAAEALGAARDAFKGAPHIAAVSNEAAWKLGLDRSGQGDPVVMLALVGGSTPLGPVSPNVKFSLRRELGIAQVFGEEPSAEQALPPAPGWKKPDDAGNNGEKQTHLLPGPAPIPAAPGKAARDSRPVTPLRQTMIALARAEVGKVDDRGGEGGERKGWPVLQGYLEQALGKRAEQEDWLRALRTPGLRAGGLRWSALFAIALAKRAGLPAAWDAQRGAITGLGALRYDEAFVPGDVLVLKGARAEHCVLVGRDGDRLEVVQGDSAWQTVDVRARKPSDFAAYYRLSAETYSS